MPTLSACHRRQTSKVALWRHLVGCCNDHNRGIGAAADAFLSSGRRCRFATKKSARGIHGLEPLVRLPQRLLHGRVTSSVGIKCNPAAQHTCACFSTTAQCLQGFEPSLGRSCPDPDGKHTTPVLFVCTLHRHRLLAQRSLRVLHQCCISRCKRSSQPAVGSILQQSMVRLRSCACALRMTSAAKHCQCNRIRCDSSLQHITLHLAIDLI